MARIYYINYIDPKTGFLKREEFTTHRAMTERIAKLEDEGIKDFTKGGFEES